MAEETRVTPEGFDEELAAVFSYDPFGDSEQTKDVASEIAEAMGEEPPGERAAAVGDVAPEDEAPPPPSARAEAEPEGEEAAEAASEEAEPEEEEPEPKRRGRRKAEIESSVVEELRRQLEEQRQIVLQLQQRLIEAQQQPPQQPGRAAGEAAKGEEDPFAQVQIPDEIVRLLESDDPLDRKRALAALVAGTGRLVYQRVLDRVQALSETLPRQVEQAALSVAEQQRIYADFYGKFPELNRPELRPLVAQVAQQVAQERGITAWSEAVRDEIGNRVKGLLASVAGVSGVAEVGRPRQNVAERRPARQVQPGSRPRVEPQPSGPNTEVDIESVLRL